MSSIERHSAEFGPFTLDLTTNTLFRGDESIHLPPLALSILRYLIENSRRFVSRAELQNQFWEGTSVEIYDSIYQQIRLLRETLGDSKNSPTYIETRYKLGWRFIAPVCERTEPGIERQAGGSLASVGDIRIQDEFATSVVQPGTAPTSSLVRRAVPVGGQYRRLISIAVVLAAAGVGLASWGTREQEAKVSSFIQLTGDGNRKSGPLLTDSRQIFFSETIDGSDQVVSVPVSGGEAQKLNPSLSNFQLEGISHDESTLLLLSNEADGTKLWAYSISSRTLRSLGTGFKDAKDAAWSPNGQVLAASVSGGSALQISGGSQKSRSEVRGRVQELEWSPNGTRLRFSLLDPRDESSSIWEIVQGNARPRRLTALSDGLPVVRSGSWTRDGNFYLYEAGTPWRRDIWVWPEQTGLLSFHSRRPLRLTNGEPGSWRWPTPSLRDSSILFAINDVVRSELAKFDKRTGSWQPEWHGAAAFEIDYSKDAQWAAYTDVRDHTIWKARPDGSQRVRLTSAGVEAHEPHWSPDGTRIAFLGKNSEGHWRVFVVSASGGESMGLLPSGDDQGVPTWSPDGRFLIFGERMSAKPRAEMSLHLLDTVTRRLSDIPWTKGLWSPRWSPDGQYIAAVTTDSHAIHILRWPEGEWKEVAKMRFIDNATWSADSRYIQFNALDQANHQLLFRLSIPEGKLERITDLVTLRPLPNIGTV